MYFTICIVQYNITVIRRNLSLYSRINFTMQLNYSFSNIIDYVNNHVYKQIQLL